MVVDERTECGERERKRERERERERVKHVGHMNEKGFSPNASRTVSTETERLIFPQQNKLLRHDLQSSAFVAERT
jgi:hypothetical protein